MSAWKPWPVVTGDWVTVLPAEQMPPMADLPDPRYPGDMQVGRTYQVHAVVRDGREVAEFGPACWTVWPYPDESRACGYLGWCRPATPEEIARAQLSRLASGGL